MAVNKIIMQDLSTMEEPVEIVSGDFLNFSKNHLITGINVIEDLLFWTDNYNQPRKININKAISDPTYYDSEDKISVAKVAPYAAPLVHEHQNLHTVTTENTIGKSTDNGVGDNGLGQNIESDYLKENFVRFSYRYKYEDNEYSLIAPFTQVVFEPLNNGCIIDDAAQTDLTSSDITAAGITARANYEFGTKKAIDTGRVATMQNAINRVKLRIPLPYNSDELVATTEASLSTNYTNISTVTFTNATQLLAGHYILKGAYSSAVAANNATTNDITHFITSATHTLTSNTVLDKGSITSTQPGGQFYKIAFVPMWENHVGLKSIEILIKESDDAAVRVVGEIDVRDIRDFKDNVDVYPIKPWSSFTQTYYRYCYVFDYKSSKPYKVIPENQVNRVSDDIPIIARAQEVVSNRIVYGNYLKNYQYPSDAAGNKGINYIVESLAKGENEYSASQPMYWLNLQHNEYAYRYGSLKQRRTYQVGVVLSDRYGRQSPVILSSAKKGNEAATQSDSPDTITTTNQVGHGSVGYSTGPNGGANFSWSTVEDDVIGNCLSIEFRDSFLVPADQSYSSTNNLGWYSYRVVVKQTQQDYYNVYTPHPIAGVDPTPVASGGSGLPLDSTLTSSYMTLFSDNINKVPRSILDQDINRNNISGSDVFLFPKVQAPSSGSFNSKLQATYSSKLIDVISLGTIQEQDSEYDLTNSTASLLSTQGNVSLVYKNERGPLVAEIENLATFYGALTNPTHLRGLSVFETEPFDSKLDVYYETSTTGLVTDLNWALKLAPPTSAPLESSILINSTTSVSFAENKPSAYLIGTISATAGSGANTLVFELLHLFSYAGASDGNDFKNRVSLNASNRQLTLATGVDTGTGFAHRNSGNDKYNLIIKVSEYNGVNYTGSSIRTLQLEVINAAPSIQLYNKNGVLGVSPARTASVSYYERFNVKLNNGYKDNGLVDNGGTDNIEKYHGLTYAITFPSIANTALRTWAERSFKVNQKANGKIDVLTTPVWEINGDWDERLKSPIEGARGLNKQDFFDLIDADRTMTITISDNAATPLTATANLQVDEGTPLEKMNGLYAYNVKKTTIPPIYGGATRIILRNKSVQFNRTGFLGRGISTAGLNPSKPRVGNVLYANREEKAWYNMTGNFDDFANKDRFVVYGYANIGGNNIQSVYDYMVISKGENTETSTTYAASSVLEVGTLEVPKGKTAAEVFTRFGDETWPTRPLSGGSKLFNYNI